MSAAPRASVVLTTYEHPAWLEKVLWGYAVQTHRDFELVIADDGSGAGTRAVIERFAAESGLRPVHVWHEDRGFRKCEILNHAVLAASGDYLIFSDGDCIPRADFVSTHLKLREPGRFLSGGYHKLPMDTSHAIGLDDIRSGRCFDAAWLRARGMPASRRNLKLTAGPRLGALLDAISPARASWNGHSASVARHDALAINGFDERLKYGGEDREFGERLEHAGVAGKRIRHRAIVLHLDHARGYVTDEGIAFNRGVREETRRLRRHWTEFGIDKRPAP